MLTPQILNTAIQTYRTNINAAITEASNITLPAPAATFSFSSFNLNPTLIAHLASSVVTGQCKNDKGSKFIYIFQMSSSNTITTQQTLNALIQAKTQRKDLCQANGNHINTQTLYVGSEYSPRNRLKQHLSSTYGQGTYAIHLEAWATAFNLDLDFYLYQFSSNSSAQSIQVIEDGLWDTLKPLLGKRGDK